MFSVVIPLYNKALYIEKAIQSVLNQTYQQFELIIVNDGSKDNSLEVVQQLNQTIGSRIHIINQENQGVSTARNNGVKSAKYDYIAFLDADDWWDEYFLEEMKGLITEFSDAGIYGCSYSCVKRGISRIANIGIERNFKVGYIDYFKTYASALAMPLTSITVVVKKEIFNEMHGFKPSLKLGEDFDLWVRIALKYKVVFLNKPLAYYNQDVDLQNRAIGKLHEPKTHILWHLSEFEEQASNIPYLKQVLDNLRVYSLFPYYLSKKYRETTKMELIKVDWTKQPSSVKRKYEMPIWYLKTKYQFMKVGSIAKQKILSLCLEKY